MTIMAEYHATTNSLSLTKNGRLIAGPTQCTEAPGDRNVNISFLGKSRFYHDDYFNGEMREIFVADQPVVNLTRVCSNAADGLYCLQRGLAHQSFAWAPNSVLYPDASVILPALLAVDGTRDTCTQIMPAFGQTSTGWWMLDLETSRLVVSLRLYGRARNASIHIGNWLIWDKTAPCAVGVGTMNVDHGRGWADIFCQAQGRYVYIVEHNLTAVRPENASGAASASQLVNSTNLTKLTNVSLDLCEVRVYGMSTTNAVYGMVGPKCSPCLKGLTCFPPALPLMCLCVRKVACLNTII